MKPNSNIPTTFRLVYRGPGGLTVWKNRSKQQYLLALHGVPHAVGSAEFVRAIYNARVNRQNQNQKEGRK